MNFPYWLTRFLLLRGLGFIYSIAFFALIRQMIPLFGENGLLPAPLYLERVHAALGNAAYWQLPTLFWLNCSDIFFKGLGLRGTDPLPFPPCRIGKRHPDVPLWVLRPVLKGDRPGSLKPFPSFN